MTNNTPKPMRRFVPPDPRVAEFQRNESGLPYIRLVTSDIGGTLDLAELALLDRKTPIFQQSGRLVHLLRHNADMGRLVLREET